MPYAIRKDGDDFLVINKDDDSVKARHSPPDAEDKAKKQVNLLHAIEHGWEPTHGD